MGTQVRLENVRIMWPSILKPQASKKFPNNPPSYSMVLILESPQHKKQVADALEGVKQVVEVNGQVFTLPPSYVGRDNGNIELRVSAPEDKRPIVVDENANDVLQPGKIYAGCYCNVVVDVFSSTSYGNKISVGLLGVQFAADGEPLDGRPSKEDLFGKPKNSTANPFS